MSKTVAAVLLKSPALLAVALLFLSQTACLKRTLVTGLSETEAREIAVALYNGHVRSNVLREPKERGQDKEKWQVDVEGGDRTQVEAWRILQENGLPRHAEEGIEEVYKNGQLIPTATEERAKFLLALSGELSRSLKTIPGVVDARVHVVVPDTTVLRDPADKTHASASVLLKYWATYAEPSQDKVKELIANGVEGLDARNISIMMAKVQPPERGIGDMTKLIPTPSLVVDYIYRVGSIAGACFLFWLAFTIAPGVVHWVRTQINLFR
jgi:type III secretion protein J